MPEVVLRFPSHPGLPYHNIHFWGPCCGEPNSVRPHASRPASIKEPSKSFKLLHLLFHPVWRCECSTLSLQHDRPSEGSGLEQTCENPKEEV